MSAEPSPVSPTARLDVPITQAGEREGLLAGLWESNPALVQMLGLCPLLAVTTTIVNGFALGLATAAVLLVTNSLISLLKGSIAPAVRIPLFVLIIASLVTCIDLLTSAFFDELHRTLGLFIPLIVTNCALLAQAETVASRRPVHEAAVAGLAAGVGFMAVLVVLGALRELFGRGTLLSGAAMLAGPGAEDWAVRLPFDGMLVAVLPPGAFFGLATLLALRNVLQERAARARERRAAGGRPS
ncbi:MAG TPA: electron transport complex subunit RsxE [Gammaproteobacteria bacterium]